MENLPLFAELAHSTVDVQTQETHLVFSHLLKNGFRAMAKIFPHSLLALMLSLSACSAEVQTNPPRTASEQMLISTAAERAADKLTLQIPQMLKVYVENSNFEGTDSKYAIGAIRTSLFLKGVHLVDDRKEADIIVETRAGALSTDRNTFLIGIPSFNVPVPFASTPLAIPEVALYGTQEQKGVAKFAVTGYDSKTGALVSAQEPQYGFAHNTKKTILIFISWTDSDAVPDHEDLNQPAARQPEKPMAAPVLKLDR